MKLPLTALSCALFLPFALACTTFPDVQPKAGDEASLSFLVNRKGDGNRDGMKQAEAYCQKTKKKHAVLVNETFEYVGTVDESTYNNVKADAEIDKKKSIVPAVVKNKIDKSVPGSAVMLDDDKTAIEKGKGYEYTLNFRCE